MTTYVDTYMDYDAKGITMHKALSYFPLLSFKKKKEKRKEDS